jgi:hypothetical protein
METEMKARKKIEYVKPAILDLGTIMAAVGHCNPGGGFIQSGEACTTGVFAGQGGCVAGGNTTY